jgi:hypothetical protein
MVLDIRHAAEAEHAFVKTNSGGHVMGGKAKMGESVGHCFTFLQITAAIASAELLV